MICELKGTWEEKTGECRGGLWGEMSSVCMAQVGETCQVSECAQQALLTRRAKPAPHFRHLSRKFQPPHSPWGNAFYYFSSPEQFKNHMLIWFIMWGPGKTVNKVSWGEEDNVFQVPWLVCSDLVQTGLCNFWAPNMVFTKASLSGQQFREKRGVRGESIQRACHAVSSGQTFSAEREEAVVFGIQSAVWRAHMWACSCNSNK